MPRPARDSGGRYPSKWTAARKVLLEWRGLSEEVRPDRAESLGNILRDLVPRMGLGDAVREADLLAAWKDVVGDFLALHSRPERLTGGVLSVKVLQPSVRYELDRNWKPRILSKLRDHFGQKSIREVRFTL